MKRLFLLLATVASGCGAVRQESTLTGKIDLSDFIRIETVAGDKIINVLPKADFNGTTLTLTNPATGVGPQQWQNAAELCERLNYGGETGFRVVSQEALEYLNQKNILSLIEGVSGKVWYTVSNTKQLNFLWSLKQNAGTMPEVQRSIFLASYDTTWQELLLDIKDLEKELANNRGNAVWGPGRCDISMSNFYSDRMLRKSANVFGVICEKKVSL